MKIVDIEEKQKLFRLICLTTLELLIIRNKFEKAFSKIIHVGWKEDLIK